MYRETPLARKSDKPDAVQHPWERILELPEHLPEPLAREKRIGEIFSETGRALLILGDPGAGKTVTLLELARELIERFETDPKQPAPVVLNLSTWQDKCRSLSAWIEADLKNKYFVPVRRTRAWLAGSRLILLLDGLDEVPAGSRASCARAINEFARNIGVPGIAVCSRRTEYTALPDRLSFTAAVCLQPLTAAQIESYLESGGSRLATLRRSIPQDPLLQELARSPLMLNVISLAYQDLPAAAITEQSNQNPESRRVDLFQCYVRRMFQRLGKAPNAYPQERSKRWLSWLACEMRRHSLTVFLLENLQPGWLAVSSQRWAYAISSRMAGRKPQDAHLTMEYAISKLDISRAYRALGKEQAAMQLLEKAKETLLDLRKGAPLSPAQTKILDKVEKEISVLERAGN